MPVLPYDRLFGRIRRPEFEQRWKLAHSGVDRGMAAKSASAGAGYDRTAARIYGRRDRGADSLSANAARIGQAARFRTSRRYARRHPKSTGPAMKSGVFLLLALLAAFSAGCKNK